MKTRTLRTMQPASLKVDPATGIIAGVAVITAGVTLPDANGNPPVLVDAVTLKQVADFINASNVGTKSRMTHNATLMGEDELPSRIGYFRNARVDGNVVRADFHAHSATDSNTQKLMSIATQDATSAGVSIVSEKSYTEQTDKGAALRIESLEAVDWVGQPAANPRGMLSSNTTKTGGVLPSKATLKGTAMEMNEQQIAYLRELGLSPEATADVIAAFVEALDDEQRAKLEGMAATMATDDEEKPAMATPVAAGKGKTKPKPKTVVASKPAAKQPEPQDEPASVEELDELATLANLPPAWVVEQAKAGATVAEAKAIALASVKKGRDPVTLSGNPTVTGGEDLNLSTLGVALQDAISQRASAKLIKMEGGSVALSVDGKAQARKPHERSVEFAGRPVVEMGRKWLMLMGYREADRMTREQLATMLLSRAKQRKVLTLAHTTSDFPELLADVMGKNLQSAYALSEPQWRKFAKAVTAADFKAQKFYQTGALGSLAALGEAEEYTFTTLAESKETATLQKYGRGIAYTWEMMINDDLNAFGRIPAELASLAVDLEETTAFSPFNNNPTMGETSRSLFNTTDNTLAAGTGNVGAPTIALLDKGDVAIGTRTALGTDGRPLNLRTKFVLVPRGLNYTTRKLINTPFEYNANNNTANVFENAFEVISTQYLTDTSAWFMLAENIDTLGLMFLEGNQAPTVTEDEIFSNDTVAVKMRHVVAPVVFDWRGFWKNPGA